MMKRMLERSIVFKGFKKELIEKYGKETAENIWNDAEKEYRKLVSDEPDADKSDRSYVFPVVALYRCVERYAPDDALFLTRSYGTKTGLKMKKLFSYITALPGIPSFMWKNMDRIAEKLSEGYEVRDLKVSSSLCHMDIVMCPLYEKAKKLGTPEAVQMICCMDREYMNGFRGIDYRRTKSVAEGDECCDYRLENSAERR